MTGVLPNAMREGFYIPLSFFSLLFLIMMVSLG